jgi:glycine betaine/choline ABC-type transport system substrate-binding protein
LEGVLDNAAMQRLNFEVDGKKRPVGRVVAEFLKQKGLT